jgi:sirohydrochlorin ferrochelatase
VVNTPLITLPLPNGFEPDRTGIVIVDHGSRREESNRRHEAFVDEWRTAAGHPIVEPAHMELAKPSIGFAFDRCVDAGAQLVVIVPYFLWPGRHWESDIPDLAAEAAARHPRVCYLVTAPLGPHPLLMAVVSDRIERCVSHVSGSAGECEICLGSGRCQLQPSCDVGRVEVTQ